MEIDWQRIQSDPELVSKIKGILKSETAEESFGIAAESDRRVYVLDWMGASLDRRRPGEMCRVWTGTHWMGGRILKLHAKGAIVDVQGVIVYASTSDIETNLSDDELSRLGVSHDGNSNQPE